MHGTYHGNAHEYSCQSYRPPAIAGNDGPLNENSICVDIQIGAHVAYFTRYSNKEMTKVWTQGEVMNPQMDLYRSCEALPAVTTGSKYGSQW